MNNPDISASKNDFTVVRNIISNLPMIFYALDNDWKFTLSDGKGLEKLGLNPSQVLGLNAKEMYKDYPDIIEAIEKTFAGENVYTIHKLGDLFLENYIAPIRTSYGKINGVVGATIDITERINTKNELDKVQAFQNALIDSIPGMLYLYNEEGELTYWNKAHKHLTGYSDNELDHFKLMDWYPDDPESQNAVLKGLENTAKNGYGEAEATLHTKDGKLLPCFFTACPIVIEGKNYFVGVGLDISNRKKAEEKLLELNKTLEHKVEERTKELKRSNEELSEANLELTTLNDEMAEMNQELTLQYEQITQMKDYLVESEKMNALASLVAGVAHEVNTPVGIGITASSHLSDLTSSLLSHVKTESLDHDKLLEYLEDVKEASEIIEKNLSRAGKLIQAFKKLSVDQSSEPIRNFNVLDYLNEILLSMSPSLKKTNIKVHIHCADDITFNSYPGAFAQIITNLVMNTILHAYEEHEHGEIHIKIQRQSDGISIRYSDDGRGIDKKILPRIYEPFYTTKRSYGGSGLGLSVVYSIVTQKFKGTIECKSNTGQGVHFTIVLTEGDL